jgi:uroporphyrinogen-III synthase
MFTAKPLPLRNNRENPLPAGNPQFRTGSSRRTSILANNPGTKNIRGNLPLIGCRVLVSRATQQAGALSSTLRELGCEVIEIPFIEIRRPSSYRPLDSALRTLASYDWLILTSVNGVDALFERMARNKIGVSALAHLKVAAIGPATRNAIEQQGLTVSITPKEYVAESVVASLQRKVRGRRVLVVRAKVARDIIPRELRRAGAHVDVVEAYETVTPKSSGKRLRGLLANRARRPHAITFTSSSTVKNFVQLLGLRGARAALRKPAHRSGVHTASIGPVTSATLREFGLPVDIEAREYTIPGLVMAIWGAGNRMKNEQG